MHLCSWVYLLSGFFYITKQRNERYLKQEWVIFKTNTVDHVGFTSLSVHWNFVSKTFDLKVLTRNRYLLKSYILKDMECVTLQCGLTVYVVKHDVCKNT